MYRNLVVIGVLLILISPGSTFNSQAQGDFSTNFELVMLVEAGNRLAESYSFFIKQSVAPLGIDIEIIGVPSIENYIENPMNKPFDLLVDDHAIHHYPTPSMKARYSLNSSYNTAYWDFLTTFQEFMEADIGVTITEVEHIINQIEYNLDPLSKLQRQNNFAELFMEELLFEFPLTKIIPRVAIHRGFGGGNLEKIDPILGLYGSLGLGAKWSNTTDVRQFDKESLSLRTKANLKILEQPFRALFYYPELVDPLHTSLLEFDGEFNPHPGLAYQWLQEDNNDTSIDQTHTYFINANQSMQFTDGEILDANDIAFTLELYNSSDYFYPPHWIDQVDSWNVSSTVFANDTITINLKKSTLNDVQYLGNLVAYPEHLLKESLISDNGTVLSDDLGNITTVSGQSYVGPYRLVEDYNTLENPMRFRFEARDDFTYPNEGDTEMMYQQYLSNFSDYTEDLSIFAPHLATENNPVFWTFSDNQETDNMEKPQSQNIQNIYYQVIEDENAALIYFESGVLDTYTSSNLGANVVAVHSDDPDIIVSDDMEKHTRLTLKFNLNNEHLQKRTVRYAIASVIDKSEMKKINDGFAIKSGSPVSRYFDNWKPEEFIGTGENGSDLSWYQSYDVPYDYATGRDLMRLEGYNSSEVYPTDDEVPNTTGTPPTFITTSSTTPSEEIIKPEEARWNLFGSFVISLVVLLVIRRKLVGKQKPYH